MKILSCLSLIPVVVISGCSLNPRYDVSYTAKNTPNVADILNKIYCEEMDTVKNTRVYQKKFLQEDMGVTLQLTADGSDNISPSSNFPAIGNVLLAITGSHTNERTNLMTQTFDFPVGELWDSRSTQTVDCASLQNRIEGDLGIEKAVLSSYEAPAEVGFALPVSGKTAPAGTFAGETTFVITQAINPGKFSFVLSSILGPTTFSDTGKYTNDLKFAFSPEPPKPTVTPMAVYIAPCPPKVACAETGGVHYVPVPKLNNGQLPSPPPAKNPARVISPDVLEQLQNLSIQSLQGRFN